MKTNPILSLRSGLTVAFQDVLFTVTPFATVKEVFGFTVTLGNKLTLGAHELHELSASLYAEVFALAVESAEEMNSREVADMRERRAWFAAR